MNKRTIFTLLFTYSILHSTFAQEKAAKTIGLREVHVEGKRYKHSAEGAMSVDVLTSDSIQKYQAGSLMQTLSRLPGVNAIGIGASQSKPQIRGLGFNRVATVENGIKHEGQQWGLDHGLEIDQYSIGTAEIIKGAGSFMYGSDAIGGVIRLSPPAELQENGLKGVVNLLTKSNNATYGGSLQLQGRKSNWVFGGGVTHLDYADYRVPTDTVYVYNYAVRLKDRQVRNTAGRETNFQLRGGYNSGQFSSIFYLSNYHTRIGFFANAHGLEPRGVNTALYDQSDRDILYPSQQVNHFKLINRNYITQGRHKIWVDLGYQRNYRQEFNHYTAHGYMPPVYPQDMNIPIHLERRYDKEIVNIALKDQFNLGTHQLTLGGNAEYQHNKIAGWSFLIPSYKQQAVGAFIHDQYPIDDQTILYAALRYDYSHIHTSPYQDWFASTLEDRQSAYIVRADELRRSFNSLVWSLGATRQIGPWETKLNVGKSFRVPIAQELAANGVNYHYFSYEKGNASLSPEQSYQVDFALARRSRNISIAFTPFFNYFANYIYLNPTSGYDQYYGAGNQIFEYAESKVRRYGAELKMEYRPLTHWKVELLGEYVRSEQLSGSKKGYTLPFSPAPSLLADLSWFPKSSTYFKAPYLSLDCKWTAKQDHIVPPEEKTAGYQVFNFRAGTELTWGKSALLLRLQVQNMFDNKYMDHTSFYRLISLPEQGRNIVLSIGIPFGKDSPAQQN
ncbi:TonB-dependent receptor [Sphingobacterium sp. HMA12]|uniref:TonB-dependent receptor n=1 Tax=Sphingobacterium sp. HMA12 TaxID=2050894 RepID=UPI000CE9EF1F|nr:TonB-dependent receptor [Sphingobacterium sp. HMA12]